MIPKETKKILSQIKENSNETFYNTRNRLLGLIFSFKDREECWDGLKISEAYFIVRHAEFMLNGLPEEIKEEIYSMYDCQLATIWIGKLK